MKLALLSVAAIVLTACGASSHKALVTVPLRAQQTDIIGAYAQLHRLGFRVSLSQATTISSLRTPGARLSPRPGSRLAVGSTVVMTPTPSPTGSPTDDQFIHVRVPDFRGKTPATAIAWASSHELYWEIPALPPLHASDAPNLFAAYRTVGQEPKPGDTMTEGVMVGHSFKPTPLTLTVK